MRIHDNRANLLAVPQSEVLPGFPAVSRFVHAIPGGEIGAAQPFPTAYVNDVRIRRRNRQGAHRPRRLAIKDRLPRPAVVRALPHASVSRGDVKDVWLIRNAADRDGTPAATGP